MSLVEAPGMMDKESGQLLQEAPSQPAAVLVKDIVKQFYKSGQALKAEGGRTSRISLGKRRQVPTKVLDNINLEIRRNEVFGVLGPNGSGKSTLIRIISTLLLPDSGSVEVFGHDVVKETRKVQTMLNRVSADAAFFRKLSAIENLQHTARIYGLNIRDGQSKMQDIMTRLGLSWEKMNAEMHELSRGMQQKVALARAFMTSPVLMLLDEPTTGLDIQSRSEVQKFVSEIQKEHDATVLLTTHDMNEAEALCNRIAILDGGKVVAVGTSAELKQMAYLKKPSGKPADAMNLEEAFLALAGHSMEAAEVEKEAE